MSRDARSPVLGVTDQVCATTEDGCLEYIWVVWQSFDKNFQAQKFRKEKNKIKKIKCYGDTDGT